MRLRLSVVFLALLAGCSDNGAHLTFQAPAGPAKAATFKVVLASPELVPMIKNQRISPDSGSTHEVSYYLQRTIAGGHYEDVEVDGFSIRIEPDAALTDTLFIPFVIFYDAAGAVVGVGTYHAGVPTPSAIKVIRDEIDIYTLDVEPAVQIADDTMSLQPGQVQVVDCSRDDQSTFTSGIVWRPAGGGEIRLLFPIDDGMDATSRALDLDCDAHAVTVESSSADCDDSRGWFHAEAQELCDGHDTNCDYLHNIVVACPNNVGGLSCGGAPGLALCDDRAGTQGTCQADPVCACSADPQGCARCIINYSAAAATTVTPCQPSRAALYSSATTGGCIDGALCTVEVLRVRGPWKVEVAADAPTLAFGYRAIDVGQKYWLQAKLASGIGPDIPAQPGASTGEVEIAVIAADGTAHLRSWDLQINDENAVACVGGGPFQMFCTP